jgi:hypothetical protein
MQDRRKSGLKPEPSIDATDKLVFYFPKAIVGRENF